MSAVTVASALPKTETVACGQELSLRKLIARQNRELRRNERQNWLRKLIGRPEREAIDHLGLYLNGLKELSVEDVSLLADKFPDRSYQIRKRAADLRDERDAKQIEELLAQKPLTVHLVDEALASLSPKGLTIVLLKLIKENPAVVASSAWQLIRYAHKSSRPDAVVRAYLNAVAYTSTPEDFRMLLQAAHFPHDRTRDFISAYLWPKHPGAKLDDLGRLRLFDLLTERGRLDARAWESLGKLWREGKKPADLAGEVSPGMARAALRHYFYDRGPALPLPEVLRLARDLTHEVGIPDLVTDLLVSRDRGLADFELEALGEAPELGVSFLYSPAVQRLLSEWSSEALVNWIATSRVLKTRTNRRHLFISLVLPRLARGQSLPGDEKHVSASLIQIAGQDRFALPAIFAYADAAEPDVTLRWKLKQRMIFSTLEPAVRNGALLALIKSDGEHLRPQDVGSLLGALLEPRAEEIATIIQTYRERRPIEPLTAMTEREHAPALRAKFRELGGIRAVAPWIASLDEVAKADMALTIYELYIRRDVRAERERFETWWIGAPEERDQARLEHLRTLIEHRASQESIAEALSRIHDQQLATHLLESYFDRNQVEIASLSRFLHAITPGRLKLQVLRMHLLTQALAEAQRLEQIAAHDIPGEGKHVARVLVDRLIHTSIPSDPDELAAYLQTLGGDEARLDVAESAINRFGATWPATDVAHLLESLHTTDARIRLARRYVRRQRNVSATRADQFAPFLEALGEDVVQPVREMLAELETKRD